MTAHLSHGFRCGIEIRPDEIAPLLGVELRRNAGRPNQVAEHHREITALANGFNDGHSTRRRSRWPRACCDGLHVCVFRQSSDGIEELHAVAQCRDAKLLQVLVRQARQDRLVYLILAECRLILSEAQAPQPDHDVHGGALNGLPAMIVRPSRRVQRSLRAAPPTSSWFSTGPNPTCSA